MSRSWFPFLLKISASRSPAWADYLEKTLLAVLRPAHGSPERVWGGPQLPSFALPTANVAYNPGGRHAFPCRRAFEPERTLWLLHR